MKDHSYKSSRNKIYVGYNLRFHPVIQDVIKKIKNKKIFETHIYSGSYLPNWRKSNYSNSYSSKIQNGGGVKLDLSHELDYCLFLIGDYKVNYYINKKISNLNIKSDDYLTLVGKSSKGAFVNISLNYFSKISTRSLIINGNNFMIKADLINNIMEYYSNKKIFKKKYPNNSLDISYFLMHQSIINNKFKFISTIKDGLKVMKIIDCLKK
tara:strand:+ start:943 stop:1572 length:630 start_codon:yes stop_codon:yes gene_type:complete